MASGILIAAVLIFALRGMFLGLSGVIGRLLGFVLGYIVAFIYRAPVAALISNKFNSGIPSLIIEVLTGFSLFIGTFFLCTVLINTSLKLLGQIIPGLGAITNKESVGGRIAGASVNGALAAAIVLMGIWAFDKATSAAPSNDQLHQIANRFGDRVFSVVSANTDLNIQSFSSSSFSSYTRQSTNIINSSSRNSISISPDTEQGKGTATITSSSDPNKSVTIDNIRKIFENQNSGNLNDSSLNTSGNIANINAGASPNLMQGIDPQALLSNPQLQQLLQDPKIHDIALEQLQNNPEKFQQLLDNPQLKHILEQLNQQ